MSQLLVRHHNLVTGAGHVHGGVCATAPVRTVKRMTQQRTWTVAYEIRSLIDSPPAHVAPASVDVTATDETEAWSKALAWVQDHDAHHDDRIQPVTSCVDITLVED